MLSGVLYTNAEGERTVHVYLNEFTWDLQTDGRCELQFTISRMCLEGLGEEQLWGLLTVFVDIKLL